MARYWFLWLVSAAVLLTSIPAVAQDHMSQYRERVEAYLTRADQKEVQWLALLAAWNKATDKCETINVTKEQLRYIDPITFDAQGTPTSGIWKHTIFATGCGKSRTLNLFYVPDGSGNVQRIPGVPGSSGADLILQRDSITFVRAGVAPHIALDCGDVRLSDTEYLGPEGDPLPGAEDRPWREYWTVNGCGIAVRVTMHFIPDATGTTIHVAPAETTRVELR
jgi:hypothetical protein